MLGDLAAGTKLSFRKKALQKGLRRKQENASRRSSPRMAPPITSPRKCLPRYILVKAISKTAAGTIFQISLFPKIRAVPPQRAVVVETCPEGKP